MKKIRTTSIQEGQRFEQAMFLPTGQKLLGANVVLTARHVEALHKLAEPVVYLADSHAELVKAGLVRPSTSPRYGSEGQGRQRDDPAEKRQTDNDRQSPKRIWSSGRGRAEARGPAGKRHEAALRQQRLAAVAEAAIEDIEGRVDPSHFRISPQRCTIWDGYTPCGGSWPEPGELALWWRQLVEAIGQRHRQLASGQWMHRDRISSIIERFMGDLLEHRRQFAQLALLCPRRSDHLPDHCCSVAVLAMATAAQLGWAVEDVERIGMAGLLLDVGMLMVPERIRMGMWELTEIDRGRVHSHPAYGVALLQQVDGLEPVIPLAVYQHHERLNGMGYPRGRRGEDICDYARVLAAVDVFAAASSPRSYSAAKLPYTVMEEVVYSAAEGIFDKKIVRAMVQAVGLFPVGSYVMLSDRRMARVLAANPEKMDRPMVGMIDKRGELIGERIDLAEVSPTELAVARPLPEPSAEMSVV